MARAPGQRGKGAVIIAAASAKAITLIVIGQKRHQKKSWHDLRPMRQRFVDAMASRRENLALGHQMKIQRGIFAVMRGKAICAPNRRQHFSSKAGSASS